MKIIKSGVNNKNKYLSSNKNLNDKSIKFSKEINDIINLYETRNSLKYIDQKNKKNELSLSLPKNNNKTISKLNNNFNENQRISTLNNQTSKLEPSFNYYIIIQGHSYNIIKKCLDLRNNWKQIPESFNQKKNNCNFLWSPLSSDINFEDYSYYISNNIKFTNHFEYHSSLTNKLFLFYNMIKYCEKYSKNIFNFLPFTIPIDTNHFSYKEQFTSFKNLFTNINQFLGINNNKNKTFGEFFYLNSNILNLGFKTKLFIPKNFYNDRNLWLIKPLNYNGGRNIQINDSIEKINNSIFDLTGMNIINQIEKEKKINLDQKEIQNENQIISDKVILQKYLEKPLLYNDRKFDMRIWVLLNHEMNIYICKEGHLKVASEKYYIQSNDLYVHLTNYTIQKKNPNFSKKEIGNEISFEIFQNSLDKLLKEQKKENINFRKDVLPKVKEIILLSMESVKYLINEKERKNCFELFGYDFIFDQNFNPYLLEINTNPGLEESSPLLKKIIPRMIDDLLKLTIDKIIKPIYKYKTENYKYPFKIKNYDDEDNLWELIGNIKLKKNKEI